MLSLCFYSNVALRAFRLSRSKRWSCIIARDMSSTDTAALALACGGASNTSQPKNLQSNSKKKSHGSSAQGTHLHLRMRLRVLDAKAINPREQVPRMIIGATRHLLFPCYAARFCGHACFPRLGLLQRHLKPMIIFGSAPSSTTLLLARGMPFILCVQSGDSGMRNRTWL